MPSALELTCAPINRLAASPGLSHCEWPMSMYTRAWDDAALSVCPAYAMEACVSACSAWLMQLVMSGSTSGSSTMYAGRLPSPAANWSIQDRYAAWLGAPPPLGPPQSRLGAL